MATTHLSNIFALFSVAFAAPTIERSALVTEGTLAADFRTTWEALELPQQPIDDFCAALEGYKGRGTEEVLHEIRREFTRLFMLEGRLVENCEGVWRKRAETSKETQIFYMINDYSMAIQDYMRECGVIRPAGYNDCIDRIDNEWNFLEILATHPAICDELGFDPLDRIDQFMDEHMKLWVPQFSAKLAEITTCDYYRAIANLQAEFMKEF